MEQISVSGWQTLIDVSQTCIVAFINCSLLCYVKEICGENRLWLLCLIKQWLDIQLRGFKTTTMHGNCKEAWQRNTADDCRTNLPWAWCNLTYWTAIKFHWKLGRLLLLRGCSDLYLHGSDNLVSDYRARTEFLSKSLTFGCIFLSNQSTLLLRYFLTLWEDIFEIKRVI